MSLAMATGSSSSNTVTVTAVAAPTLVPSDARKYTVRAPMHCHSQRTAIDAHADWSWDNSMVGEPLQLSEATADTSEAVIVTAPAASNIEVGSTACETAGPVVSWTVNRHGHAFTIACTIISSDIHRIRSEISTVKGQRGHPSCIVYRQGVRET